MKGPTKYRALIISILLTVLLLFGSLPASNAQVTTGAQFKRVIFRDDDVTPWSLGALEAVNQVHIDEGVPVTLGVIPARSFRVQSQYEPTVPTVNSSEPFADYLRSLKSSGQFELPTVRSYETFADYLRSLKSSGQFELAQHGYQHCDNSKLYGVPVSSEFRGMPYDKQYSLIAKGRSLMQNAFGTAPTTFIPPFSTGDTNTLKVLSALGFTVYSSLPGEPGSSSGGHLTLKPQRVDISKSDTFESLVRQTKPLLNDPSVSDIVVVYHNWQFEASTAHDINTAKVAMLRQYIQYLKTNNVEFTTLNGAHSHSGQLVTALTLATSNPSPAVSEPVTFTATLKSGTTPLSGKYITIYHYLNGVRYTDATKTTNSSGQTTFTQSFSSGGLRSYYATFPGDKSYKTSTSRAVYVNVGTPTTLNLIATPTAPTIGKPVTFTATLKSGTTPLSGKYITIYHYLNGVRYTDATKTTNTAGQITFTQTFGSTGQRQYYATFVGDSSHASSTSSIVYVNVGSTQIAPSISTTSPTGGKPVTFTATLKSSTTLLSFKRVTSKSG